LGYDLSKILGLNHENAAPTAMIGASNHFEVAIAIATMETQLQYLIGYSGYYVRSFLPAPTTTLASWCIARKQND
jgi:hypothetical protein